MTDKTPRFRQFMSGEWFADIDGKRIARKSIFTATVYPDDSLNSSLHSYKSRIEHCGSCLDEDNRYLDECCCVHVQFHSKNEENEYLKSIDFWKIPYESWEGARL